MGERMRILSTHRLFDMLLGAQRECEICNRRMGQGAGGLSTPDETPFGLVVRRLQQLVCRQCLASIPWITEVQCAVCGRATDCPDCIRRSSPQLVMNRASVQYNSHMKEWLSRYKYRGDERLQKILATMLDFAYLQMVRDQPLRNLREVVHGSAGGIRSEASGTRRRNLKGAPLGNGKNEGSGMKSSGTFQRNMQGAFSGDGTAKGSCVQATGMSRRNMQGAVHGNTTIEGSWIRHFMVRLRSLLGRKEREMREMFHEEPFQPIVTYVPISEPRRMERGFNQAERLAEELAARYQLSCAPLFRRIRHTERQSHKSRYERLHDLRGAFALTEEALELFRGGGQDFNAVLIVDDVYTTGSTLHECARALGTVTSLPVFSVTWAR